MVYTNIVKFMLTLVEKQRYNKLPEDLLEPNILQNYSDSAGAIGFNMNCVASDVDIFSFYVCHLKFSKRALENKK